MLSPATFIGIANAIAPTGQPAPASSPNVRPARAVGTPPATAPITRPPPPQSGTGAAPPRNLPRGSLLDLSV